MIDGRRVSCYPNAKSLSTFYGKSADYEFIVVSDTPRARALDHGFKRYRERFFVTFAFHRGDPKRCLTVCCLQVLKVEHGSRMRSVPHTCIRFPNLYLFVIHLANPSYCMGNECTQSNLAIPQISLSNQDYLDNRPSNICM